jgi:hypothetical protein
VGPAAGFNCPDWKMRKLDGSGEVLAACGGIGLVKDAGFSLPMLLPMLLSTTSAQTLSGTWQQTTRELRAVVRRTDSRNSRSTT